MSCVENEPNRGCLFLFLIVLIVPLGQIPVDFYSPALPDIAKDLKTSATLTQFTVTIFIIFSGLGNVPIGAISDALGRRKVLLVSLVGLILSTVGCAVAPSIEVLFIARAFEGFFAASGFVICYAYAGDSYSGHQLTRTFGILGAAWASVPVIAPGIGGIVVHSLGWRPMFWILSGFMLFLFVLFWWTLPESLPPERRHPLKIKGVLKSCGVTLANKSYLTLCGVFMFGASIQFVFVAAAPFLYQKEMQFSARTYGFIALAIGFGNLIGNGAVGLLAKVIKPMGLILIGLCLIWFGTLGLLVSGFVAPLNALVISITLGIALIGSAMTCPASVALAVGLFPERIGIGSALISTVGFFGVGISVAVGGILNMTTQLPMAFVFLVLVSLETVAFLLYRWALGRETPTTS